MTNKMEDAGITVLVGNYLYVRQLHKRTSDFKIFTYLTKKGNYTADTDTKVFWTLDDK